MIGFRASMTARMQSYSAAAKIEIRLGGKSEKGL